MRFSLSSICLCLLLLTSVPALGEVDYLARMAQESEIKAIAVVTAVKRMGSNRDGTFYQVTFKTVYGLTPYIPNPFVGGCKTYEYAWQQRSKDMVYFKPRKGQKVYVTVSTNGGGHHQLHPAQRPAGVGHSPRAAPVGLPPGRGLGPAGRVALLRLPKKRPSLGGRPFFAFRSVIDVRGRLPLYLLIHRAEPVSWRRSRTVTELGNMDCIRLGPASLWRPTPTAE